MTTPWRGTAMFVGVAAVLGAAAAARFAAAEDAASPPAVQGAGQAVPGTSTTGNAGASSASAPSSPRAGGGGTSARARHTVVGSVASTPYGPVQVSVTFDGTRITAVQELQVPRGGRSDGINAQAAPVLAQQVVAAQSARIDGVSGATYTSQAYEQSVQYAIDHA